MTTIAMANADTVSVQADVLNVRSGPGLAYDVTSQVRKGTNLKVIGEENDWYQVRLEDGNTGYVASWLVENTSVSAASNSLAVVSSDGNLNVRKEPSTSSEILGTLNNGDQINVISEQNGWAQIKYQGQNAWVDASYITIRESTTKMDESSLQKVTVREDNTNIRSKPDLNSSVIEKASSGDTYAIQGVQGDWYKVQTKSGAEGYIANWVVDITTQGESTPKEKSKTTSLSEATIVLDPGHGGNDPGAEGTNGTLEKKATLKMANVVADKLRQSGAKVILTRDSDEYVSLSDRTKIAEKYNADVFISLHFDSLEDKDSSVSGQTTYYYSKNDKGLAKDVNEGLEKDVDITNRGYQVGDYYVLRENDQPALLLELGYLSSPEDEARINSSSYRNQVAQGIYDGLADYFAN
ncbi:N-acetylmuramoyl-L-alanine amidase [Listeria costaricensis]|uniref:N-acetylmuramoyl-L-alanine amidase n=1 Tax=Listeria costaricensis TaxID=2026604 RepID=UPI000C0840E1|nr:N-acetylmuramoyl-L-alanine amidase [Listeria costaricensis]